MLYFKAFHIIFMVTWFAGLFYLPRLFVYHADATDWEGVARFKIMERRLYYGITWPGGLLTALCGVGVLMYNPMYYMHVAWFHAKLALVALLWCYHLSCGHYLKAFKQDKNVHTARFYRLFNELPTVGLISVILLVVVKPA